MTRLVLVHFRAQLKQLSRVPAYVVPTLLLPPLFFLFFGYPNSYDRPSANTFMTAYSAFAVLGVSFFQFGVGIATERASPWETYVRTLPLPAGVRLTAQALTAMVFAGAAVGGVVTVALLTTRAGMEPSAWLRWSASLLAGSVPFVLIGVAVGYTVTPAAAVPVANLLYLPLAFLGGLFLPPAMLPTFAQRVSELLPTRHYAEIAWSAAWNGAVPWKDVAWLVGYTILFAALAGAAYRRDSDVRTA